MRCPRSVHNLSYGYSTVNTVSSLTDNVYTALSETLLYDAADRLTSVSRTDWQFDARHVSTKPNTSAPAAATR